MSEPVEMVRVVSPAQFVKMWEELANPDRSADENAFAAMLASGLSPFGVRLHEGKTTRIVVEGFRP